MLGRSDDDWPEVYRYVGKACRVWSRLRKLLIIEGADPQVSEMFYLNEPGGITFVGGDLCFASVDVKEYGGG